MKVTGYSIFEKLLALNYNSFILTVGIIGVDSHTRGEYTVQCDGCEKNISGAAINLTVCAVNIGVLCWNLAESKFVLKMCISKHCHEVTGFLSWIGTYCISCVVHQRSRVKDLYFLVGYVDS